MAKKKVSKFSYFIIFILFIAIGVAVGYYGTFNYLEYKNENDKTPVVVDGPVDITENEQYQDTIDLLISLLNGDPIFYSTKGVEAASLDNTSRLNLIYHYILNNELDSKEVIKLDYVGASTCKSAVFLVDPVTDINTIPSGCTVSRIDVQLITEINTKIFNDELLDTSVNFNVDLDTKCVIENESYLCGTISNISGYTGSLESNFEIIKVTKDKDGFISIFEKGYLKDNRSYVDNKDDLYDNYYLHSSDSKDYYYELKSADNLTFKHTFKYTNENNYYYVSTKLVKE